MRCSWSRMRSTCLVALFARYKSMTVLRRYIREGNLFSENAAAAIGL